MNKIYCLILTIVDGYLNNGRAIISLIICIILSSTKCDLIICAEAYDHYIIN